MKQDEPSFSQQEKQVLIDEIEDLKMLYETVAEHSSLIENELEQKNREVSALIQQLRKYLSPQLYQSLLGGNGEVSLHYKRRFLTIFFSDIVGFTEISDRTDPEILSDMLNGYLNEMAQIATQFGGTIDKFIGDALMIFFGDPEYINDQQHAIDCSAMALEMMKANKRIDMSWKQKGISQGLRVRMGIHSGYCTVGNFGSENRMDYTIIGGNVNIASRLEGLAETNSIYISSVTKNLLPEAFQTRFIQNVQVKGVHYPIEIFELLDKKSINNEDNKFNSWINEINGGFELEKMSFYPGLNSEVEKSSMIEAIQKALLLLQNDKNL